MTIDELQDNWFYFNGKFYTLDVAWDAEKKKYFAFEANSASGLNAQTAAVYAEYLADKV